MKPRKVDELAGRLHKKTTAELAERLGRDWMSVSAYVKRVDPRVQTVIKSISIRVDRGGCFIVMRGRYGADDVVQLRQAGDLDHALSYVAYMVHKGTWKPDKFGVDGNSLLAEPPKPN